MEKEFLRMKLADLVPYENNPRHNEEAVDATIASMQQCGNIDPIEVDENNVILSGHTRRLALMKMGYEESDIVRVSGLTDLQKKKYRILANKTNEFAGWDFGKLEEELDGLDFEGFDFGFISAVEEVEKKKEEKPEVEFTEVLGEEHNYVVLYFDNMVDWLQMESILDVNGKMNLSTRKDGRVGKNMKRISVGRVFNGAEALERFREHFENLN